MSFLRKYFLWILLIGSIISWGYVRIYKKSPCEVPIRYSIGTFDNRFNISKKDFIDAILQAHGIWDRPVGKDLFKYSPLDGDLLINLIYDSRQNTVDKNKTLTSKVDETKQSADEIKAEFLSLKEKYNQGQNEYLALLEKLKQDQGNYNSQVDYWNKNRGAPSSEYIKLEKEKDNLMILRDNVEKKRLEVNGFADEINALVKKYNFLVTTVNATIGTINQSAGKEFEEGQYVSDEKGERINIYEFANKAILVRVLAHELGHALGLDHNNNPDSIMYYLNTSKNIKPTVEDIRDLKELCRIK